MSRRPPRFRPFEPGFDIAADRHDLDVGPQPPDLSRPPGRRGAHDRALLQRIDQVRLHDPVTDIAPRPNSSDVDAIGPLALDVLHRMDEKSTSPPISARSSSLVHSALPPMSASGRSWTLSPVVLISTIWTQPSG